MIKNTIFALIVSVSCAYSQPSLRGITLGPAPLTGGVLTNYTTFTNVVQFNNVSNRLNGWLAAATAHGYISNVIVAETFMSWYGQTTNGFIGKYTNSDFTYGQYGANTFASPIKIALASGSNFTAFVTYSFPTNFQTTNINGALIGLVNESFGDGLFVNGNCGVGYNTVISVTNSIQNSLYTNGMFWMPQASAGYDLDGVSNIQDNWLRRTDWIMCSNGVIYAGRWGWLGQLGTTNGGASPLGFAMTNAGPFHSFNELVIGAQFSGITQQPNGGGTGSFLTNSLANIESVIVCAGVMNSNYIGNISMDMSFFNPATTIVELIGDSKMFPRYGTNADWYFVSNPAATNALVFNFAVSGQSYPDFVGATKLIAWQNLASSNSAWTSESTFAMLGNNDMALNSRSATTTYNSALSLQAQMPANNLLTIGTLYQYGTTAASGFLGGQAYTTVLGSFSNYNQMILSNQFLFGGGVIDCASMATTNMVTTNGLPTAFSADSVHPNGTNGYQIGKAIAAAYWGNLGYAPSGVFYGKKNTSPGIRPNEDGGTNLVLNGSLFVTGVPGFTGDGSGLTGLNASSVSSGTVADARLSGNVPLLNVGNTFSTSQKISGPTVNNGEITLGVKNTTASGTASLGITNSSNFGAELFKTGPSYGGYKTIGVNAVGFYNDSNGGDIAVLNDYASGNILLSAGGHSYPDIKITPSSGIGFAQTIITTNGVASLKSNGAAPTSISVTASPFTFTAPAGVNIQVYIDGGTGTFIAKNGTTIFTSLLGGHTVGLQAGETVSITYTVAPTMSYSFF